MVIKKFRNYTKLQMKFLHDETIYMLIITKYTHIHMITFLLTSIQESSHVKDCFIYIYIYMYIIQAIKITNKLNTSIHYFP